MVIVNSSVMSHNYHFFLVVRTLQIHFLRNLQVDNTVLLTVITIHTLDPQNLLCFQSNYTKITLPPKTQFLPLPVRSRYCKISSFLLNWYEECLTVVLTTISRLLVRIRIFLYVCDSCVQFLYWINCACVFIFPLFSLHYT